MKRDLYFIHHSSYLLVEERAMFLFDYFGKPSIQDLLSKYSDKHLYVIASHSHGDHYTKQVHTLFQNHPAGVSFIFHKEVQDSVPSKYRDEVTYIETGASLTIDTHLFKAYGSTDIGGSFYIETEGYKLFHAGDLNNWHWNEEASLEYIQLYEQQWAEELHKIVQDHMTLDLLMFPTDLRLGKDYLKGLREFMELVPTKLLAPMHINGEMEDTSELQAVCEKYHVQLLLPTPMHSHTI